MSTVILTIVPWLIARAQVYTHNATRIFEQNDEQRAYWVPRFLDIYNHVGLPNHLINRQSASMDESGYLFYSLIPVGSTNVTTDICEWATQIYRSSIVIND